MTSGEERFECRHTRTREAVMIARLVRVFGLVCLLTTAAWIVAHAQTRGTTISKPVVKPQIRPTLPPAKPPATPAPTPVAVVYPHNLKTLVGTITIRNKNEEPESPSKVSKGDTPGSVSYVSKSGFVVSKFTNEALARIRATYGDDIAELAEKTDKTLGARGFRTSLSLAADLAFLGDEDAIGKVGRWLDKPTRAAADKLVMDQLVATGLAPAGLIESGRSPRSLVQLAADFALMGGEGPASTGLTPQLVRDIEAVRAKRMSFDNLLQNFNSGHYNPKGTGGVPGFSSPGSSSNPRGQVETGSGSGTTTSPAGSPSGSGSSGSSTNDPSSGGDTDTGANNPVTDGNSNGGSSGGTTEPAGTGSATGSGTGTGTGTGTNSGTGSATGTGSGTGTSGDPSTGSGSNTDAGGSGNSDTGTERGGASSATYTIVDIKHDGKETSVTWVREGGNDGDDGVYFTIYDGNGNYETIDAAGNSQGSGTGDPPSDDTKGQSTTVHNTKSDGTGEAVLPKDEDDDDNSSGNSVETTPSEETVTIPPEFVMVHHLDIAAMRAQQSQGPRAGGGDVDPVENDGTTGVRASAVDIARYMKFKSVQFLLGNPGSPDNVRPNPSGTPTPTGRHPDDGATDPVRKEP